MRARLRGFVCMRCACARLSTCLCIIVSVFAIVYVFVRICVGVHVCVFKIGRDKKNHIDSLSGNKNRKENQVNTCQCNKLLR